MEQLGVLPTPEAVLNKLKSDGTFDQLRKSCLATIEAEPSFRAHGEHVEILTRRYLQDFKWKEKTTRNEVRAKLRSYVIGAIAKPELAVGMPLGALVEKTLEAQAKELLPKIVEKVEILRASKAVPLPDLNPLDSSNGPNAVTANTGGAPDVSSSKIGSDFGGLPLPIEIPGLTAPKKEAASTGGSGSDIAASKSAKSKSKVADGSSSKDGVKAAQKLKLGGTTSGGKVGQTALPKESVKQKEKGEKTGIDSKEPLGDMDSKEKNKGTFKVKKSKEEKQKDSQEKNQKPQALISKEKGADTKEVAKKEAGKGAQKESSRLITKGESDKNESRDAETRSSAEADTKASSTDSNKSLPPRRSARLASLTENKDEEVSSSEAEEQHSKRDTVSGNKSNTSDDESITDKQHHRKKRQRPVKVTSRKRARVLRSSSEDSEQEEMRESVDEEGYESETEEPAEEERLSKKVKSGSARKFEAPRKRKHVLPESEDDNTGLTKKSRTLKQHSKLQFSIKRRMKLSLSPVPVVTRYNRQVKPNRKYCVSEEDPGESETSAVEEDEEQQQLGTEESSTEKELRQPQDQESNN